VVEVWWWRVVEEWSWCRTPLMSDTYAVDSAAFTTPDVRPHL
jgi:hypothetical protein